MRRPEDGRREPALHVMEAGGIGTGERVCNSARPVKPYVHRPWRMGRSKPPIAANDGSAWSGLRSPEPVHEGLVG